MEIKRYVYLDSPADDNFNTVYNHDPHTLIIVKAGYENMGAIYSRGPVLLLDGVSDGPVHSESWVYLCESGRVRNELNALTVIIEDEKSLEKSLIYKWEDVRKISELPGN